MPRAVGFLCGAGSLLHEARALRYDVVGNVDTRSYFKDGRVWRLNFPRAPFTTRPDVLMEGWYDADLAIGHPPCGSHSILGQTRVARDRSLLDRKRFHARRAKNAGLLPLFAQLVNEYRPKVFALDNLPKIMTTIAPPAWWERSLPGYRLTYLTIVNWDYGSCQTRERLWVIGTRAKRPFVFEPLTRRPPTAENAWEALDGLPWEPWRDEPELAHVHLQPSDRPLDSYWLHHGKTYEITLKSDAAAAGFLSLPPGYNWPYVSKRGLDNRKPGKHRMGFDRASVFGAKDVYHPLTGWPLTPRERARIMGWPDDFRLWDVKRWGWSTGIYRRLIVVTGKAVPSHFPRYLLPQLRDHARRI